MTFRLFFLILILGAIKVSKCGEKDSEGKAPSKQSIKFIEEGLSENPVSYTHLTLPTIYSV